MESILNSIKKLLGLSEEYDAFDNDIIIHINSVLSILTVKGVGPAFAITGYFETWDDYLPDAVAVSMVKNYVYLRVRQIFDPPTSSFVQASISESIKELEFYLESLTKF